ncbi:hypothetical protein E1293_34825 [Actinomadura darangshiensis]|uniref:Uncharacterized protein n=1 Tax=Actinomadura darangshiensis TaxID=705336 RepID=A0A4R5AJS6_9ACTN|nr:hypothetical protein [Actinomadura darangshiensis]TDD70342.1 hypothetical protein E1293_34825 [Actinomadura darangshiensis]
MSTRTLGLVTTTAAISLALTGGIAAAAAAAPPPTPPETGSASGANPAPDPDAVPENPNAADPDAAQQDPAAAPEKPAQQPPKAKSAAKDGTDLAACMDAKCEVEVKDGDEIALDKKYGMDPIHVKVDGTRVTFSIRENGSKMLSSMDASWSNSATSYNGIMLRPHKAKDGSIILNMSHA